MQQVDKLVMAAAIVGTVTSFNVHSAGRLAAARITPMQPLSTTAPFSRAREASMVALTGETLKAAMKMRTDTSGAGYAIFWANIDGNLVVAGDYVTPARKAELADKGFDKSFAEESEGQVMPVRGFGPIASAYRKNESFFVSDVAASNFKRKDLALKYGIAQVAFTPMEGGVIEYGTSDGPSTANWETLPDCPVMPKSDMRKGFENLGASYGLFWQKKGDVFEVVADYTTESRRLALAKIRGDDKTFATESRAYNIAVDGDGPIATAWRTGEEGVIDDVSTMKRKDLAKEFGIKRVHFVPTPDGIYEYGVPADSFLSGPLMEASLKMRCDTSGAGYAIYWKLANNKLTIAGSYVTQERKAALEANGKTSSFAEASNDVMIDINGEGPLQEVLDSDARVFIPDVAASNMKRKDLAREYGISSVCFVPVEGGVMEFGVSDWNDGTADWKTVEDACKAVMPKAEMKAAFQQGATHLIFWQRVGDTFEYGASYIKSDYARALKASRGDEKTYVSESSDMSFELDGEGPVATAARSNKEIIIEDAALFTSYTLVRLGSFKRMTLASEFSVKNIHFVPCRDGVIEYGVGTMPAEQK